MQGHDLDLRRRWVLDAHLSHQVAEAIGAQPQAILLGEGQIHQLAEAPSIPLPVGVVSLHGLHQGRAQRSVALVGQAPTHDRSQPRSTLGQVGLTQDLSQRRARKVKGGQAVGGMIGEMKEGEGVQDGGRVGQGIATLAACA